MVEQNNFVGWDFQNIWEIDAGGSYPYLKALPKPGKVDVNSANDPEEDEEDEDEIAVPDQELLTFNAVSGENYQVVFYGKNLNRLNEVSFIIHYNAQFLTPINSYNGKELTIGQVQGSDYTVTFIDAGIIKGSLNKAIPPGQYWNGIICIFKFKAISSGNTSMIFSYS